MSKNNPGPGDQYLNTANHVTYTLIDTPDEHGDAFATFSGGKRKSLVDVHREQLEFVQPALVWPRTERSNQWLLLHTNGTLGMATHFPDGPDEVIARLEMGKHANWVDANGDPIEWTE